MTKAIILAGGKGERLRPYTDDKPKPMVPVGGIPDVEYQVIQLKKAGVKEIVFAVSYKKEYLMNYWGDGSKWNLDIHYSEEDQPLGRGGGIKKAMRLLKGEWEDTLVTNGDNLWKLDIPSLVNAHQISDALVTMVVVQLRSPYGIVEINDLDQVVGFVEKPLLPHWVNGGVYVFSKDILEKLPDIGDHEVETFPNLSKEKFLAYKSRDFWKGFDTIKDLIEAEKEVTEVFKDLTFSLPG
ncbi:hypothetical protein A3H85_01075 [Candidatus Daviesbacteria bacterium RIFCSPLOWO2_02_FULL_40_8]|uniref:Nucleotidyl transferase domain-containing protein n=1 Tax=Candidatus Daviesbacteria bacterium RIFCSPLOWO2_01_FULL_40_24 TaxID=1797787 RepID=A0A1F5MK87_9BACT|nr:MAG: hypothetical protein A2780_02445 [Candidatus Daviesbacteria bacterium RIFCSPHIGHO2_01_FULL_41_45]OGE35050.1 MAG: hypothetical protein A3C32_01320 [Candidatus Daviesbacteria bacterium RIFCSPHIGHO2_02_FULL_41_14]OGE65758.1 MAG: hypothetical protein A3B49_02730 [Candidatus Daviesbacteria bacterium RIFCSPLOWO2_01_FULL_40_24]OGE67078.1 MAG: hypothetical protein A3H85_01075 [Candidatus Daviesbacteria bacterium RIFCSPLOWO2_02_FULL_40_8]